MLLGHNVVADREAKPGAFAGWLGREEWLEQLVLNFGSYTDSVIANANFNGFAEVTSSNLQDWAEARLATFLLPFGRRVKSVPDQIDGRPD